MLIYRYWTGAPRRCVRILELWWDHVPSAPSWWARLETGNGSWIWLQTLGNIMRNDEFWVFTCSESLSAPFLAILKWNDDLRRWFSPKRHMFKRRLSTSRFNWLTFIFSQYNIYILYIFCGVIRIQILDWWSSSRKKNNGAFIHSCIFHVVMVIPAIVCMFPTGGFHVAGHVTRPPPHRPPLLQVFHNFNLPQRMTLVCARYSFCVLPGRH